MIDVNVAPDKVSVSGHAGHGIRGHDIVCAGVSALSYTLLHSLDTLTDDHVSVDIKDGYMELQYENLSERGRLLIDSFFVGICRIAERYPESLHIA